MIMACSVNQCVSNDGCSPSEYSYSSEEYGSLEKYKNIVSQLENLNFAEHNYNEENAINVDEENAINVDITRFNPTKLTVERNGNTSWKVLYDNKTLILNFKSFSGVICRSKRLPRQIYVRINDLCLKKIYREICNLMSFDKCQGVSRLV